MRVGGQERSSSSPIHLWSLIKKLKFHVHYGCVYVPRFSKKSWKKNLQPLLLLIKFTPTASSRAWWQPSFLELCLGSGSPWLCFSQRILTWGDARCGPGRRPPKQKLLIFKFTCLEATGRTCMPIPFPDFTSLGRNYRRCWFQPLKGKGKLRDPGPLIIWLLSLSLLDVAHNQQQATCALPQRLWPSSIVVFKPGFITPAFCVMHAG